MVVAKFSMVYFLQSFILSQANLYLCSNCFKVTGIFLEAVLQFFGIRQRIGCHTTFPMSRWSTCCIFLLRFNTNQLLRNPLAANLSVPIFKLVHFPGNFLLLAKEPVQKCCQEHLQSCYCCIAEVCNGICTIWGLNLQSFIFFL